MRKKPPYELITYYLSSGVVTSAQTGKEITKILGPYCVSVQGQILREPLTDQQVNEYVENMHGCKPIRIERSINQG